jgi:hypothetical protein
MCCEASPVAPSLDSSSDFATGRTGLTLTAHAQAVGGMRSFPTVRSFRIRYKFHKPLCLEFHFSKRKPPEGGHSIRWPGFMTTAWKPKSKYPHQFKIIALQIARSRRVSSEASPKLKRPTRPNERCGTLSHPPGNSATFLTRPEPQTYSRRLRAIRPVLKSHQSCSRHHLGSEDKAAKILRG